MKKSNKKPSLDIIEGDAHKIVPFSTGNITIKKAKEMLKDQNATNTTWLVPKSFSNNL